VAGAYDATLKQLLDACAPDWVAWLAPLCGPPAGVGAQPLDVDLSTVQPVADKVFRLQPPASGLLHLEVQSSWDGGFADRLLLYNVLLEDRYGGPVHTAALLLRREASASGLTGTVARLDATGREYLRFAYTLAGSGSCRPTRCSPAGWAPPRWRCSPTTRPRACKTWWTASPTA
jgi:hypothetical protein